MADVQIKIVGLDRLIGNINKAPAVVYKSLNDAVSRSAWRISTNVKSVTPVDTGALKRGIRPEFRPLKALIKPHNAPYALYVHEGTRFMKARPFLKIGLENSISAVKQEFNSQINKALIIISKI